jgi:hypothetical protein
MPGTLLSTQGCPTWVSLKHVTLSDESQTQRAHVGDNCHIGDNTEAATAMATASPTPTLSPVWEEGALATAVTGWNLQERDDWFLA